MTNRIAFNCPHCNRPITPSRAVAGGYTEGPNTTVWCVPTMPPFSLTCTCGHTTINLSQRERRDRERSRSN